MDGKEHSETSGTTLDHVATGSMDYKQQFAGVRDGCCGSVLCYLFG
jgi:hypothetical protein